MKKLFSISLMFIISSSLCAKEGGTFVGSNSVFNQFQCNNGPWEYPKPNIITYEGTCTPLKGKARNTDQITVIAATEKCPENMNAVYTFDGWENKFNYYGCQPRK